LTSHDTTTALEEGEYQFQKSPEQKYPSPEATIKHPKESHNADFNDPPPRPDLPTFHWRTWLNTTTRAACGSPFGEVFTT
jgi:hypothetical protein